MRRTFEETKEFQDKYRWRAGIEATMSHYKLDIGAKRLSVRGLPKVRFAVVLKALGLNILRCVRALEACLYPFCIRIWNLKSHKMARKLALRYFPYFIVKEQSYL